MLQCEKNIFSATKKVQSGDEYKIIIQNCLIKLTKNLLEIYNN